MEQQQKIIIIDDDMLTRVSTADLIKSWGYEVETAASFTEGVRLLSEAVPDVAIIDLRLPDGDGMELLSLVREQHPEVDAIILTGHASIDSAIEAIKKGAENYLEKPSDPNRLFVTLKKIAEKKDMRSEISALRRQLQKLGAFGELIGKSKPMQRLYGLIERVSMSNVPVLITGESGSGKEVVAQTIHGLSKRRTGRFVAINCGAVPPTLIENELFGHERGAFTGADQRREGYFEMADDGTIFLDEIAEMPTDLQVKLLRVLEQNKFRRIGGRQEIEIDVRVISATNRDPFKAIEEHKLREDLYYRLNVFPIHVPPLRDRLDDIPLLASYFLEVLNEKEGKNITGFEPSALEVLLQCPWPGNVRELRNVINRAYILAWSDTITLTCLPDELKARAPTPAKPKILEIPVGLSLQEIQRQAIQGTLEYVHGDTSKAEQILGTQLKIPPALSSGDEKSPKLEIELGMSIEEVEKLLITRTLEFHQGNKPETAKILGISLKTLYNKLERYELKF
ncbi:MAG: sigma-54-dependent Fis family transcriptional regulator [Nitrospinae bacterium]|nr:sigma-54-dependent Fis family transcriptional regulator [Nitrospinota bacterium]